MCRLLAYLGPPVAVDTLLLGPAHSLLVQSYQPREMTSGTVNADGFGFAWYDSGRRDEPFLYRTILPIWNDPNLADLASFVRAGCVLANVRSATPGQNLDFSNTQPFTAGPLAVMHNGFVEDFRTTLYRILRDGIGEDAYAALAGNTDSEHLFAWILHHMADDGDQGGLDEGLAAALAALAEIAPEARMTLNFIVSDGRRIAASRHARHADCPSLYWIADPGAFPGAVLVASEPMFDDPGWQPLAPHSVIAVDADGTVDERGL